MKFVIITPTRNEDKYIHHTLESMIAQSLLPIKWIIVDDGSNDNTSKIIKSFMRKAPFIKYVYNPDRGYRKPGAGVVEAFYTGYKKIGEEDYDVVAKFDADLQFPPHTLKNIANAFEENPNLGITGAIRYERSGSNGQFRKVLVPAGFVGGPTKFYRKQCFNDIDGLIPRAGWDGVDTIKANMHGWETGELRELKILHLKPTGTSLGEGLKRACEKYGDVSYYMGGYFWYFILRMIGRSVHSRNPKVGYFMLVGYFTSLFNHEKRESSEFRKFLKKIQRKNILYWFSILSKTKTIVNNERNNKIDN
jgi:biofilm PGA synthesis N-glycosyltransferase PgaC